MFIFIKKNLSYILSVISGVLLSLAFSHMGLDYFVWFGLVPLLIVIEKEKNIKTVIVSSALCGLVFYSIVLYWVYYVTILGLILLVIYLFIYFVLFALALKFLYSAKAMTSLTQIFVIPSVWVVLEYLRSHLFTGFGWASLGYAQYRNLAFIQIADLTGVYGVSFIIIVVNVVIKEIIVNIKPIILFDKKYLKKISYIAAVTFFSLLLVYIYGDIKLNRPLTGKKLRVSVIQANIAQCQKWEPFYRNLILEKYKKLTRMASFDEPDIIMWPETSLPGYLDEKDLFTQVSKLADDIKTPILIGAPREDKYERKYYNSAALISKSGKLEQIYNKIHLVPFGEYLPAPYIFSFSKGMIETADFSKGKEYTLFNVKDEKFGVLICFEETFSNLVRKFVKTGADFMVNISNDAWFMQSTEPYQHLQASVFRAVENRINVVRAANTGISCFVDPYGRITKRVVSLKRDIFVEGYKTQTIYIKKTKTFYLRFGDIFVLMCLGIVAFQTSIAFLRK